jgi:phospholipid/cholesterol/gamma-HCH transport system substrate-binding protein
MMHNSRWIEIMVGSFIILALVALFFLAIQVSNLGQSDLGDSYHLQAYFDHVGSLKVRAPVYIAGVRIGRVTAIEFDQARYQAVVTLSVSSRYDQLPVDTFASIFTAGLLGEQYINLDPGGRTDYLQDGDQITYTQSALVLEQLISQFLFQKAGESKP